MINELATLNDCLRDIKQISEILFIIVIILLMLANHVATIVFTVN